MLKRNRYYRGTRAHSRRSDRRPGRRPEVTTAHKVEAGQARRRFSAGPGQSRTRSFAKYGINKQQFFSIRAADMFYLLMNTERPLFKNNPKLRQAVNFALDRTAMLRVIGAAG